MITNFIPDILTFFLGIITGVFLIYFSRIINKDIRLKKSTYKAQKEVNIWLKSLDIISEFSIGNTKEGYDVVVTLSEKFNFAKILIEIKTIQRWSTEPTIFTISKTVNILKKALNDTSAVKAIILIGCIGFRKDVQFRKNKEFVNIWPFGDDRIQILAFRNWKDIKSCINLNNIAKNIK